MENKQLIICADSIKYLSAIKDNSINLIITSPPYNLKKEYNYYKDNLEYSQYLKWCSEWTQELFRILSSEGSLFLNVGNSCKNPWISSDIAYICKSNNLFLQNKILWVKSISIKHENYGHFKPINSDRFLNNLYEDIYHFTKNNKVKINRLSIGVPYTHKSNISRWKGNNKKDKRCRGNIWFIPYETVQSKKEKFHHPAIFPEKLVENCIKLCYLKKENWILDPFGGSGTVATVCKKLKLNCISIDIDKKYCLITKKRLSNVK